MSKRQNESEESKEEKKYRKKIRKYEELISKLTSSDPEVASTFGEEEVSAVNEKQEEDNNVEEDQVQEEIEQEDLLEEVQDEGQGQENLSPDILKALGNFSEEDNKYSEDIKPEIVNISVKILTDGLSKESHEDLRKSSKIPKNMKLLDAPQLNPEFTGLLTSSTTGRDKQLTDRQQDLGKGTALICNAINALTDKDFNKIAVIKMLSDSVRLLGNLHHQYTLIRRRLIAPFLDKSLIQNLNENKRSEYLYSKLEESVKTSSAMKRTMNVLKPKTKNYPNPKVGRQQQFKTASNNYKAGPTPYKTTRNPPRPAPATRPAGTTYNDRPFHRRPTSSNRGGRAKYP